MKKFTLIILIVAALGGGIIWFMVGRKDKAAEAPMTLQYVAPATRTIHQNITVNGTINPVLSTEIKSEVSGRIAVINIKPGDTVTKGQTLLQLDPGSLRAQIDEANLNIESATLRAEQAELDYKRMQALAEKEFVNNQELEASRIDYLLAQNDLSARRARLQVLQDNLKKTVITAPYDGTILNVNARLGMVVTGADSGREGVALLELADLGELKVQAKVNEIDVPGLRLGSPVRIFFESVRDLEAKGDITFISPSATGATGGNPQATRDFPVEISVIDAGPRIRPGMTARVEIEVGRAENAVSVEAAAVFHDLDTDETYVFVRNGAAEPERRVVVTGIYDNQFVEIRSGLKVGEEISLQKPVSVGAPAAKSNS